jgi:hypothetical protein
MNTTLKKQIILDLDILEKYGMLHLVSQFVELMKHQTPTLPVNSIKQFAGTMAKEDVEEIEAIINAEFNNIEGEW